MHLPRTYHAHTTHLPRTYHAHTIHLPRTYHALTTHLPRVPQRDNELIKRTLKLYDDALERYIPVLMAQARIYWDMEHYPMVEKIFRQSAEFCSEHELWKLNVAHVFFLQVTTYPHPDPSPTSDANPNPHPGPNLNP